MTPQTRRWIAARLSATPPTARQFHTKPLAGPCRDRPFGHTSVVPATVIVGAQWGDEGKGKIVDLLAQHSDLVCRYQGGPNAGHTIIADGETYKIRALPRGITRAN